jgi:hypothetical protein
MEQNEIYNYLTNKYKELNILDISSNIIESSSGFDFNIYPDTGYIPQCSICNNDYTMWFDNMTTNNKDTNIIDMKHNTCGCIWIQYYKNKILAINPNVKFDKKKF